MAERLPGPGRTAGGSAGAPRPSPPSVAPPPRSLRGAPAAQLGRAIAPDRPRARLPTGRALAGCAAPPFDSRRLPEAGQQATPPRPGAGAAGGRARLQRGRPSPGAPSREWNPPPRSDAAAGAAGGERGAPGPRAGQGSCAACALRRGTALLAGPRRAGGAPRSPPSPRPHLPIPANRAPTAAAAPRLRSALERSCARGGGAGPRGANDDGPIRVRPSPSPAGAECARSVSVEPPIECQRKGRGVSCVRLGGNRTTNA